MELKPIRTDNQDYRGNYAAGTQDYAATAESRKVLRNTYLLLALTMVPTVIGDAIGIQLAPAMMASPILSVVLMLGSVIGLQFAIARYRNSGIGVALLLLMTGLVGMFLGPLLNVALSMRNGVQLVSYSAVGTGVIFLGMGVVAQSIKRDLAFMGKFLFVGMIALLVAMLANMNLNYLTSGTAPGRAGNAHQNIVPYQVFAASDGHLIVTVGNDSQFTKFCAVAGVPQLAEDAR